MTDAASPLARIRMITSPASREMFRPLRNETVVQFPQPLTDREYKRVAKLLSSHPEVALRAYGSKFTDLEFLKFFTEVRHFQADYMYKLESIDGLRHLPMDLNSLVFGETKTARQFSLTLLHRFRELRSLYLEKHSKDIEVLGELTALEEVTLRSITLPNLVVLLPLHNLLSLELKLGGTRDLSLLPRIGRLRYLELWQIRGLDDVEAVGEVSTLQYLFLQSLRNVTRLPDMSKLNRLRRVVVDTMKGITDLSPLAAAPALEQLLLVAMKHISLEDLECLRGHPKLREAVFGLGSLKRNAAAYDLIGVDHLEADFKFAVDD